jgi:hypothetical protein
MLVGENFISISSGATAGDRQGTDNTRSDRSKRQERGERAERGEKAEREGRERLKEKRYHDTGWGELSQHLIRGNSGRQTGVRQHITLRREVPEQCNNSVTTV